MKIKNNIITLLAAIGLLTSCSDDIAPTYTVGEADKAIVLRARVSEGGNGVMTRAVDGNHARHTPFAAGNKMTLQINGTWTGKGTITQTTTGTTKAEAASSKHNAVETSPLRFWNDYGVADPANIDIQHGGTATNGTGGREEGLTIYGAAVNDATAAAPTVTNWEDLAWNLPTDQKGGWTANDLLTSNNITSTVDGTFKFDDFLSNVAGTSNILEFTHAMSKVTVVLTAGDGFPESKFAKNVSVTLKQFKNEGNVNIKTKTSSATSATNDIQMHLDAGGINNATATFDALVYPGNEFTDATDILELEADGNAFVVTAAKLNAAIKTAINESSTTGYPLGSSNLTAEPKVYDTQLVQGWNYKLQITVNKTGIKVLATIVDWDELTAAPESPKIRITDSYGQTGTAFEHDFDFFRSLNIGSDYSKDAYVEYNAGNYVFHNQLYWPDHSTHYFFRGVYPRVQTASEAGWIPAAKFTTSTSSASNIAVQNAAYEAGKYPSDLAIGYPRTTTETCTAHSKTVATQGICATEGTIRMNFEYVMSQVEVKLTSAAGDGHVNLDANTVIKIVGGYTAGNISMEDGSASCTGSTGAWTMLGGTALDRLDAIVPQTLGDMKFVITVKNDEDNYDTYECRIASIKVGGNDITEWEAGKKYVYTLEIQKTAIKTMATIKDWVTVNASENVWF